jgi:hypothetical protein
MSTGENELGGVPHALGPRFLTDEQIIDLYRKATARQLEIRNENALRDRDRLLFAGFWDFVLYGLLILSMGAGGPAAWVFLAIVLFLARFVPIGPFSTVYWLNHRHVRLTVSDLTGPFQTKKTPTNKERLKNLHWMNKKGPDIPAKEDLNPYSLTVMRTVAEALTQPLMASASLAENRLAAQREGVEALIDETEKLCEDIHQNRMQAGDLEEVFDTRLTEAQETVKMLKGELKRIEKGMWEIQTEIAPLRAYIKKLAELEVATRKLTTIRNQMATVLGVPAGPLEQLEFQQLPQRLENARQNLSEIGASLKAYEQAVAEVQELRQGN